MNGRRPKTVESWLSAGLPNAVESPRLKQAAIPRLFTDFVAWLNVELLPGQRVLSKVAFDGVDPCDLDANERIIARSLFGNRETFSAQERRYIVAVCGARAGKTYILIALRVLHLALTVPLDSIAPGQVASAPIIAPDKDLATEAINYIGGAIRSKPELLALCPGKTEDTESIDIQRERTVEIVVRAAAARGQTGRGRSLVAAALDEAAFFRDHNYKVNDTAIYEALSPRVLPGGQLIIASTPWAQIGLLYDLFVANHPDPSCAGVAMPGKDLRTAIAIHAATLTLRDVPMMREVVAVERRRDEENASREYDAKFMSAGTSVFFDADTIAKCIDTRLVLPRTSQYGEEITSGGDLGFAKNSSALAVVHWSGGDACVGELLETKPQAGALLKPSVVVGEYASVIARHGGSYLMGDGHYKATAVEALANENVGFVDAPTAPADAFIAARTLMREGRVRIPDNPRLIQQMRETLARRSSGGNVTIVLPLWKTGEHGDLVAALVLALFQRYGEKVKSDVKQTPEEAAEAERDRRREAARRGRDAEGWERFASGNGGIATGGYEERHGRRR